MTEHTDKASRKTAQAAPKGQPGKTRSPRSKRAKTPADKTPADKTAADTSSGGKAPGDKSPGGNTAGTSAAAGRAAAGKPPASSLAPDPATVTFGSNRPIVATPRKLPESSGLHFAGPSAGELKASGPQPTSAKAGGLTFTSAKTGNGKTGNGSIDNGPTGNAATGDTATGKNTGPKGRGPQKADTAKAPLAKTQTAKMGAAKNETAKPASTKPGGSKPESATSSKVPASGAKTPAPLTKPAIAPQASGRRLDKERSSSGFVLTLLGLVAVVSGLAFWLNGGEDVAKGPAAPQEQVAAAETAPQSTPQATLQAAPPAPAPAAKSESPAPPNFGPSVRAPVSPGPLVAVPGTVAAEGAPKQGAPTDAEGFTTDLSLEQIAEMQRLLDALGLTPGNLDGILTAETAAAIRAYQEMAGLPADGGANAALLEELRTVAQLYGS